MSSPFSKKFCGKNPVKMSPLNQGGYEGGGDVEGKYYIPTGQMYADMFGKIGQAVADIDETVRKNKKKKNKKEENKVTNQVVANFCPPGQNC
jgi:hypothetical protein